MTKKMSLKGTVHSFNIRDKSLAKWFPDDRLNVAIFPPKMPLGPVILKLVCL